MSEWMAGSVGMGAPGGHLLGTRFYDGIAAFDAASNETLVSLGVHLAATFGPPQAYRDEQIDWLLQQIGEMGLQGYAHSITTPRSARGVSHRYGRLQGASWANRIALRIAAVAEQDQMVRFQREFARHGG